MGSGKKSKGGRYTPPAPRRVEPVVDDHQAFWDSYNASDRVLRQRCARLVDPPPTSLEWAEATLMEMGGHDASDDELIGYWRVHRYAEAHNGELPDLAIIGAALAAGTDPVEYWVASNADDEEDEDELD
jgi:hypothetical protein